MVKVTGLLVSMADITDSKLAPPFVHTCFSQRIEGSGLVSDDELITACG